MDVERQRGTKPRRISADERRMTFIVVPHGGQDLGTRSFEISYRRLRIAALAVAAAVIVWLGMAGSWFFMAAQVARIPGLEGEVEDLQKDRIRVEQLARTIARMEARYEQVRTLLGPDATLRSGPRPAAEETPSPDDAEAKAAADSTQASLPRSWPLAVGGFVTRGHLAPLGPKHPGIDIAVRVGTQVRAAGAGTVLEAGEDSVYGRFVRIRHRGGYESMYAHASRLLVAPQDPVRRDEVIALSGNTGVSTAPHLHFEIRKDGNPVDPATLVHYPK